MPILYGFVAFVPVYSMNLIQNFALNSLNLTNHDLIHTAKADLKEEIQGEKAQSLRP